MNASEKNSFEEQWRGAFENAENTPDPVVWARIETRLADADADRYRRKLFVLRTRMAAAVALLVLALGGWAAWQYGGGTSPMATHDTRRPVVQKDVPAGSAPASDAAELATRPPAAGSRPAPASPNFEPQTEMSPSQSPDARIASGRQPARPAQSGLVPHGRVANSRPAHGGPAHRLADDTRAGHRRLPGLPDGQGEGRRRRAADGFHTPVPPPAFSETFGATSLAHAALKQESERQGNGLSLEEDARTEFAPLSGRDILATAAKPVLKDLRWQMNQAFWNQLAVSEAARQGKESWKKARWQVGAGFQPSAFDPNFNITGQGRSLDMPSYAAADARLTNSFANAANTAQPDLDRLTRRGVSYATGIQAGFALSNRVSVEGGVQYTYNQSQLEVSQYLVRTNEWQVQPLFYELLDQGDAALIGTASALAQPSEKEAFVVALNAAETKVVDNTYRYVGFPVRVVYKLLNRKVRASVGAGLSADVFLRNRISSSIGDVAAVEINRADNTVYRNVGLSGQVSVKLDYTIGGRYSVYIEPSFRRAVTSFTTTPALQSFPSWWGVGTGLQYRF